MNLHKKRNQRCILFVIHLLQDMEPFGAKEIQREIQLNILHEFPTRHGAQHIIAIA